MLDPGCSNLLGRRTVGSTGRKLSSLESDVSKDLRNRAAVCFNTLAEARVEAVLSFVVLHTIFGSVSAVTALNGDT
jgi:hypothetical protein